MTDDLVQRLRNNAWGASVADTLEQQARDRSEAADRIEALTAENERLRDYWYRQGKDDQHQVDADRIEAQAAEIERLREAIKIQASAARVLHHNEETEINHLRKIRAEAHRAIATLDSERDMNALLTEEIEALTAEVERLRGVLLWIRGVCAEELDLEYTDAMRRAFQRNVRDAALNALTTPEAGQPWLRTYDEHLKGEDKW